MAWAYCEAGDGFPRRPAAAGMVEAMVAAAFSLQPWTMRRPSRGPAIEALARQVAIYLAHTRLGFTLTAAGACFGRDRTTAAHACRIVEQRREVDPVMDAIVDYLERAVDAKRAAERAP